MNTIFGVVGGPHGRRGTDLRAMAGAAPSLASPPTTRAESLAALATTDERGQAHRHGITVVADAALADRTTLRRVLGLHAGERTRVEDAELILHAYLKWGERCGEELVGAYAFAIWDPRRAILVCGRDHIGMRPLHWWSDGRRCVFASDPEIILAHPAVERRADLEAYLASVVRNSSVGLDRSVWQGIRKVRPAQLLALSPEGVVRRRQVHWCPAGGQDGRLAGPGECVEALRAALTIASTDAVRTSEPDEKVGAHVSGGLDSSAVAVLAHRALDRSGSGLVRVFSWAPPPDDVSRVAGDERSRVEAVARQLDVPVSFVGLDSAAEAAHASRVRSLRPTEVSSREWAVIREARNDGIRVLMSGWGGDELASFNGRGVLARMARTGRWVALARELVGLSRRRAGQSMPRGILSELYGRVALPLLPVPVWRALRLGETPEEKRLRLEFGLTWSDVHRRADELAREGRDRFRRAMARGGRAMQVELVRNGHLAARLEAWALLGAEHGIEHRYPLLDRRVMDLCLSFPETLWLRDGWGRWLFRAAVEPLLPAPLPWSQVKDEPALFADVRPAPVLTPAALERDPTLQAVAAQLERRLGALRSFAGQPGS
jgi:asparagine synthase (glutamine-hydrolysing)